MEKVISIEKVIQSSKRKKIAKKKETKAKVRENEATVQLVKKSKNIFIFSFETSRNYKKFKNALYSLNDIIGGFNAKRNISKEWDIIYHLSIVGYPVGPYLGKIICFWDKKEKCWKIRLEKNLECKGIDQYWSIIKKEIRKVRGY